ncbi:unnamed protein product [Callosobruchus maculatus]|uniref:Uncharacterized protein n=1 Tax=Callosobruchus maculatus TaxID=64391 RepID=A0A653CNJ8_CALMS|nr:unnamed protein product [Callosobruchus maculatus]
MCSSASTTWSRLKGDARLALLPDCASKRDDRARDQGLISKIAGAKIVPESYTCSTCRPYEKGEMFNIFKRVASEAPTLSPGFKMWTSLMISIVLLEILVGILRAWKKEVFSGPNPVFCAGMTTGRGAMAPARAGARNKNMGMFMKK